VVRSVSKGASSFEGGRGPIKARSALGKKPTGAQWRILLAKSCTSGAAGAPSFRGGHNQSQKREMLEEEKLDAKRNLH